MVLQRGLLESGVFETQTLRVCPTEPIICVKEFAYGSPKFLVYCGTSRYIPETFLNANIRCNNGNKDLSYNVLHSIVVLQCLTLNSCLTMSYKIKVSYNVLQDKSVIQRITRYKCNTAYYNENMYYIVLHEEVIRLFISKSCITMYYNLSSLLTYLLTYFVLHYTTLQHIEDTFQNSKLNVLQCMTK